MAQRYLCNLTISRDSLWFQAVILGASALLCLTVAAAFWFQPDSCAALPVLPRWLWLAPGLSLALLGWTRRRKVLAIGVAAIVHWVL